MMLNVYLYVMKVVKMYMCAAMVVMMHLYVKMHAGIPKITQGFKYCKATLYIIGLSTWKKC